MNSNEFRRRYLNFFSERGHAVIPSVPVVPENDPTVLFTTAGMHPLVPYLMGEPHPAGRRLASCQKCIRTGDIDEVGDNTHLTFFEMLGNWSLGDYFKDQSIRWSFEFLTSQEHGLGLDPKRLFVTVFEGDDDAPRDDESVGIWKEVFASVGVENAETRIFTLPKSDNWWGPAGQTGPCGPDTEIFYDMKGTGRFEDSVEIWNNVFMQYNKLADGTFEPLAQSNVDTGMGFERMLAVLQGVDSVYDTDVFEKIFAELNSSESDLSQEAKRITADHIRAAVIMVGDGVVPSNKGQGYVLRRLIRRATLHVNTQSQDWSHNLVRAVVETYAEAYPELTANQDHITRSISEEVAKFQRTLERGKQEITKREALSGKDAFDLYQSYGFPLELTKEYAASRGVKIDEEEFEREFRQHQDLSRTASAGQFASGLADHSEKTVQYHTATHLLHQALKDVLGAHVAQRGSNITPERLRFDFTHPEKMTDEQISQVEVVINEQIGRKLSITVETMSPDAALTSGAIGLFGHKYGDSVTVYTMGDFSKEICTGPHAANTGDLGKFTIVKEEAVSAGVRRIKAVLE